MTSEPQQKQTPPETKRSRVAAIAHAIHHAFHFLWSVLLGLFILIVYLWIVGLPESVTDRFMENLQTEDFHIQLARARLNPFQGIELDDVRLSGPAPMGTNFVRASALDIRLDLHRLLRREIKVNAIRISGGQVSWPYTAAGAPMSTAVVSNVESYVFLADGERTRVTLKGDAGALDLQLEGEVKRADAQEGKSPWAWLKTVSDRSQLLPSAISKFQRELGSARLSERPVLRIEFFTDPHDAAGSYVRGSAEGQRTFFRGGVIDEWRVEASLSDQVLDVNEVLLKSARGSLRASAHVDYKGRTVNARVRSDLPPGHTMRMLPKAAATWVRRQDIHIVGEMKSDLRIDTAPFDEAWDHLRGTLSFSGVEFRNAWVDKAQFTFDREGDDFFVTNIVATIGRDAGRGPLAGDVHYNLKTGVRRAQLDIGFDPNQFSTLMSTNQARVVALFEFPSKPPALSCTFERNSETGAARATGQMDASDFAFRGAFVDHFTCSYDFENGRLTMPDWNLQDDKGSITGLLALDFKKGIHDVDFQSTADPNTVKKLIGPKFEKSIRIAHFNGRARISARGRIDTLTGTNTDLRVAIKGDQIGVMWFTADQAQLDVRAIGRRYDFTNVHAFGCGGTLDGTFSLYPDPVDPHLRYEVSAVASNMTLSRLMSMFRPDQTNITKGIGSATLELTGLVGEGQGATAVGTGSVAIAEGELFKMRILGPLSTLLSSVFPGLGFASQTDFKSGFQIERGRAVTRDAMLMGTLISVRAEGAYYFDQRLKFIVEVKPLRKGIVAQFLRVVTAPVTTLFEFNLTGTVKDPKWRPNNLPKEMFLIFD